MNRLVILLLFAVAIAMFAVPNEGAQELNPWDKSYQPDNSDMKMAENEIQPEDMYDMTEVKEGLYEEENDNGREKRAVNSCGPDVTYWLVGEMNRNMNHIEIKYCRAWYNTVTWPRCLTKFAGLVGNCRQWDYKCTQSFRRGSCPSSCPRTVTLCGRCVNYDVPGNIHYGWVGRAAYIRRWLLLFAADRVQKGGVDDPKDQDAIRIGMDLRDTPSKRSNFCGEVLNKINSLNLDGTSGCYRCSTKY